jgi:large subunit ribosomal protein L31
LLSKQRLLEVSILYASVIDIYREVKEMREGIHPNYYETTVTCNCGNTFVTGSTKKDIHVEVCSNCHSFYTGQQKSARADGRIDKFNKRYGVESK